MIYRLGDRVPQFDGEHWVAPNATVIGSVRCAPGVSIWFNCVLRGDNDDITIGEHRNIHEESVLHPDPGLKLPVGSHCTIGHSVLLHGCERRASTLFGFGQGCFTASRNAVQGMSGED